MIQPNENDILCGRGAHTRNHPGNETLRTIVERRLEEYEKASTKEKQEICKSIVQDRKKNNVRFLVKDEEGEWREVEDAFEKVGQRFRNFKSDKNKEKANMDEFGFTDSEQKGQLQMGSGNKSISDEMSYTTSQFSNVSIKTPESSKVSAMSLGTFSAISYFGNNSTMETNTSRVTFVDEIAAQNDAYKADIKKLKEKVQQLELELGRDSSSHTLELESDMYSERDLYVGTMKDDKRDGPGYLALNNGQLFVGQWKDDLLDGRGVYESTSEGRTYKGVFAKGDFKEGTLRDGNGKELGKVVDYVLLVSEFI